MAIFDFMKKKKEQEIKEAPKDEMPIKDVDEKLTEEGELPWGWLYRNKEFTDKINEEYTYFLNKWVNSRQASPKEHHDALKSFVLFMEDSEKLCNQKGECFAFWYGQILTTPKYRMDRRKELELLEENFDAEMGKYQQLQEEIKYKQMRTPQLRPEVISKLQENPGMLQSEFWKLFNEKDKTIVSDIIYDLVKSKKIEKEKFGRSYKLFYKR